MKEAIIKKVKNENFWIAFLVALILSCVINFGYPKWHLIILIGFLAGFIATTGP